MTELTLSDWDEIQRSLEYSRYKIESYGQYPSYEYKRKLLDENYALLQKVRAIRKQVKHA